MRWAPYSGTRVVVTTRDNRIEILRTRGNREELHAIGAVIRETNPQRVFGTRVERALGLDDARLTAG
jgi:hypothetical protein